MIDLYGIPNCNTMKKARSWLDAHAIDYTFHNYKTEGISTDQLRSWAAAVGWELLLNRRGTTWRKLDAAQKEQIDAASAIDLMATYPSMIKRPVLVRGDHIEVGFSEAGYAALFGVEA